MSTAFKGVIYRREEAADEDLLDLLPEDLADFYRDLNGIVAFNGGLQIRACAQDDAWDSLYRYWKGERALHRTYANLFESDIPFASDCLGDQFIWRDDSIWLMSAETGEMIDMEVDLEEFIATSIEDPIEYLAMEPLAYHLEEEGPLKPGELIHIIPALSEDLPEETAYHIDSLSVDERLDWLATYYQSLETD